ncbi:MAG: DUF2950 family protein, partial [Proteobacteria bacterium]|nr:DUF2950 family protein [Pseudomonadota bacterium]
MSVVKAFRNICLGGLMISGLSASALMAKDYTSAEGLANGLAVAVRTHSIETMQELFGEDARETLSTGNTVRDKAVWSAFIEAYDQEHIVQRVYGKYAVLLIGDDNWAFPMPLLKGDDGFWTFDVAEGVEEIARRKIGRNELEVIEIMKSYVEVQAQYRSTDRDGDGVLEFAATIISSAGEKDGLFWPGKDSPAGDFLARAEAFGYVVDGETMAPEPYAGYVYRLFNKQSENAPGGALDYIVNGNQIAGHAAIAVPAEYGVTGVMSFIVSENGQVLQLDLGEDGLEKSL